MPYSTSKINTAAVVANARNSSLRRNRAIRRSSAKSINLIAANITRAPRAASGKVERAGPRNNMVSSTITAVTREYSWVRLPTASPITVRLPLLLTGKPENKPGAEVGRTQRQELLAGVDHLPPPGREGTRRHNIVGVGDDGDTERCR